MYVLPLFVLKKLNERESEKMDEKKCLSCGGSVLDTYEFCSKECYLRSKKK